MHAKPHRQNSDFQLRYFLAGDCKTPDGAWCLMYGQKIDMESKIRHSDVQLKRREAKIAKARHTLKTSDLQHERLEAEADILEQEADTPVWELNLRAAKMELATIERLMAELEPLRKYGHLPLLEASEAAQREEWLEELKVRAENFMITQGTIPHDHLNTMRMHPDFKSHLAPYVTHLLVTMKNVNREDTMTLLAPLEMPSLPYNGPAPIPQQETQRLNYGPK